MSAPPGPVTYRFTNSPLPSTLLTDLKALNALTEDQLHTLFNIAVHYLSGAQQQHQQQQQQQQQHQTADEELEFFTRTHNVNIKPLRATLSGLLFILSAALQKNLSAESLSEDLTHCALNADTVNVLREEYRLHYVSLTAISLSQVLMVNELTDFEWKFGVTAASSDMNHLGTTFLTLKITIKTQEQQKQQILMELTLPQFYTFLQQMQIASRQAELLTKNT